MREWLLIAMAALLAISIPTDAQDSTYIHISTHQEFQYRSDQTVTVPFEVRLVLGNVGQDEPVRVSIKDGRGQAFPVQNADYLIGGVPPYPSLNVLNLGYLEPGRYKLTLQASAGGLTESISFALSVQLPPVPYEADLTGKGDDGRFFFEPKSPDENRTFTIRVYRDGSGGKLVLNEVRTWQGVTVPVPTFPDGSTKVEVVGPNTWRNYDNPQRIAGYTTYPAWEWNPNYKLIEQAQDGEWLRILGVVLVLLAGTGILGYAWRKW